MATPFTSSYSQFAQNLDTVAPGLAPSLGSLPTPAQQTSQALGGAYTPNPEGVQALQVRSEGKYSNKQMVAPLKFSLNIEGTSIVVDYLGKRIITDNKVPYKAIVSLSAVTLETKIINDPYLNAKTHVEKQAPTAVQSAAGKIFNTGTNAVTNSLGSRFNSYSSLVNGFNGNQIFSNLQAGIPGQLNNLIPQTQINQAMAKIPGLSVATNALGNIPGAANLTKALGNPVGAASSLLQNATQGLNIQGGMPSVSLGSLGDAFSLASDIANSGPPTSLTGLINIEKQVKALVCNFKLPTLTIPAGFPGSITDIFKGFDLGGAVSKAFANVRDEISDIGKQVKKDFEDTLSNIKNQIDIVKQLAQSLPDPKQIFDAAIKEITTCDSNPNSEGSVKSGTAGNSPGGATPTADGGFAGNAESQKILDQANAHAASMANVKVTAADRAAALASAPTSDPGFKGFSPGAKVTRVY